MRNLAGGSRYEHATSDHPPQLRIPVAVANSLLVTLVTSQQVAHISPVPVEPSSGYTSDDRMLYPSCTWLAAAPTVVGVLGMTHAYCEASAGPQQPTPTKGAGQGRSTIHADGGWWLCSSTTVQEGTCIRGKPTMSHFGVG